MCCSASQVGQGLVGGTLQTFAIQELVVAMQGPRQHDSSSLLGRGRRDHGYLGIALVLELEHMHIRSIRHDRACEATDVLLCIHSLQQELCLCSCPPRVCRQHNAKGQQELGNCQETLMHALRVPSCSPHQVPRPRLSLEEDDCHLATQGLFLAAPLFSPCQGLVLCDVQERGRGARDLVHEALCKDGLNVVSPGHCEGSTRGSRSSRSIGSIIVLQQGLMFSR